jgi:glycosyltransferase involved in cell wall biosynthesis
MRIGIDCSCLAKEERTGVARYCASLLHALPGVMAPQDRVTALYRLSRLRRKRWFERVPDLRFSQAVLQDRLGVFPPRNIDVAHGSDLRLPLIPGVPAVSTVHDLAALDVPGIARESFKARKRAALRVVADRAAQILCISEFTRDAFLSRYPNAEERTCVVPLGLHERFRPRDEDEIESVRTELGIEGPYLLFVGQISTRKNLLPLLEAFCELRNQPRFADLELVLAGPVQIGGEDILEHIEELECGEAIRLPGYVGDDVLPALYSGADAFCFTGKAEGFGLPVLEAMACACPVVAADAGATASTAGGAALMVPPDDAGALGDALAGLLDEADTRVDLIARGIAHASGYSWAETARKTLEVYRAAIRSGIPA